MRSFLFSLCFGALLFPSCSKNTQGPEIIVEPPFPIEIKLDSIEVGTLYNVSIGDDAEDVYKDLQVFSKETKRISYLGITGFLNRTITDLKDRIPLYSDLILDQKPSSSLAVQLSFENDKISSIYYRDGRKVNFWPSDSETQLKVGDAVETIYDKLIKLYTLPKYTRLFDYIGMFNKNIDKPFDTFQNGSSLWQFSVTKDEKNFVRVDLVFEDSKLIKIRSRHERYE